MGLSYVEVLPPSPMEEEFARQLRETALLLIEHWRGGYSETDEKERLLDIEDTFYHGYGAYEYEEAYTIYIRQLTTTHFRRQGYPEWLYPMVAVFL